MSEVTAADVRGALLYCPSTGEFRRAVAVKGHKAGEVVGCPHSGGYIRIGLFGREFFAHRLAWLYVHGEWPADQIDHINGNRADNRICNLRQATDAQNRQNLRAATSRNKSSGELGVTWDKSKGKWKAQICVNGKRMGVGHFESVHDAKAAYLTKKAELHPFQTIAEVCA